MILNTINVAGNKILDNISTINALLSKTRRNQLAFPATNDLDIDDTFDEDGS